MTDHDRSLVVRESGALARAAESERGVFESLRSDFRRTLPGVRAFGLAALVAALVLFACTVVSFVAGGATATLLMRTALFGAYAAGAFYVAIVLLSDADAIDRALISGYSLEFETMFLEKRRGWQRMAAVGGVAVGVALTAIVLFGSLAFAHKFARARAEATTRARMEKIVADAELYAIRNHEYPPVVATGRDSWGTGIVYAPVLVNRKRVNFFVRSAGRDRKWNTHDDITLRARVVLK